MEQYIVTGMSCAACSTRVEKAVSALEGVTSCSVSLLTNTMGVEGTASTEAIIQAPNSFLYFISPSSNISPHSGQNFGGFAGSCGSHPHLSHLYCKIPAGFFIPQLEQNFPVF